MEVEFKDVALNHLETDRATTAGYPPGVVKAFRKRMQGIRAAADESIRRELLSRLAGLSLFLNKLLRELVYFREFHLGLHLTG